MTSASEVAAPEEVIALVDIDYKSRSCCVGIIPRSQVPDAIWKGLCDGTETVESPTALKYRRDVLNKMHLNDSPFIYGVGGGRIPLVPTNTQKIVCVQVVHSDDYP